MVLKLTRSWLLWGDLPHTIFAGKRGSVVCDCTRSYTVTLSTNATTQPSLLADLGVHDMT